MGEPQNSWRSHSLELLIIPGIWQYSVTIYTYSLCTGNFAESTSGCSFWFFLPCLHPWMAPHSSSLFPGFSLALAS
jgi:hypothetical protein